MIVLDTNIVSEAMKPEPYPAVRAWLNGQATETLYLSTVTVAELLYGLGALPVGRRKDLLAQTLEGCSQDRWTRFSNPGRVHCRHCQFAGFYGGLTRYKAFRSCQHQGDQPMGWLG